MSQATTKHVADTDDVGTILGALGTVAQSITAVRAHERVLQSAGVRVDRAGAALLYKLATRASDNPRVSTLADLLNVDFSTVTRKVHQLEQMGLLQRSDDPEDKRAVRLALTPDGTEIVERIMAARRRWLDNLLGDFDGQDVATFADLLQRFAGALDEEMKQS
jgi:DNA-binding MarR family transcriptional regulator